MSVSKEITLKKDYKGYSEADKIIRYLINPEEEVELTATEKKRLDVCKQIHVYRFQYHKKSDIVSMIIAMHGVKQTQAYSLIRLTEEIFGKVEGVHKDYERNFLLECSRKNIELAMKGRNSGLITKALLAHYKLCGLDEFVPDMPDFAKLEAHQYLINLPQNVIELLKQKVAGGDLKITDIIPPPNINFDQVPEAEVE